MTVKELIEILKTFSFEKEIIIDGCFYDCPITEIEITETEDYIVFN